VLRVPFRVAPGLKFEGAETKNISGARLTLTSPGNDYNVFLFEGIPSAAHAHRLFADLKTGALAAGLYIGGGVQFDENVVQLSATSDLPKSVEVPMIYPQGRSLARMTIRDGQVEFIPNIVAPKFVEGLEVAMTSAAALGAMKDARVELAAALYAGSFFETSPQAQFFGLIGVLEVLRDQGPVSDQTIALVDRWIAEAKTENPPELLSLRSQLEFLKEKSINQGIRALVDRHVPGAGPRVAKLYDHRSKLVHSGIVPDQFDQVLREAQTLVRKVLAKILSVGNR
jgi:hypothetical protein